MAVLIDSALVGCERVCAKGRASQRTATDAGVLLSFEGVAAQNCRVSVAAHRCWRFTKTRPTCNLCPILAHKFLLRLFAGDEKPSEIGHLQHAGSAMLARDTAQLDEALARPQRENVGRRVAALCGKLLQRSIELGNYMSLRFEIRWVVNLNNRSHQAIGPLFSETARVFASSLLEQVAVAIG